MMRFTTPRPRRAFHQPPGRENAQRHVEYAAITATLAQKTDKAILLTSDSLHAWVPLHKLETSSRVTVYRTEKGGEITVHAELEFALAEKLV